MIAREHKKAGAWDWRLTFIGKRMGHNFYLHYLVDQVLTQNPQIRGIVEIGTAHGALTLVLGLWGEKLRIPVLTIDRNPRLHDKALFKHLGIHFFEGDEFGAGAILEIRKLFRAGPVFLICDGGNKPLEFLTWAPAVPSGSVIGAHDWGSEIGPHDVEDIVAREHLIPFLPHKWDYAGVQFAMWRKP